MLLWFKNLDAISYDLSENIATVTYYNSTMKNMYKNKQTPNKT